MTITKTCSRCKRDFPLQAFRKQRGTKDGLQYECKKCTSDRARERYLEKQNSIIEQNTTWQQNNRDKHAEASKRHYESPTGRLGRSLNRRLDELLGKNRESFFHLIGLTPSVLIIHLTASLLEGMKIEDYGDKWLVGFVSRVVENDLASEEGARAVLNWKNLQAVPKENEKSLDLQTLSVD